MSALHKFHDFGKFGGCDLVKIHGKPSKKYHPHPAIVFLIVGKYMKVPEHLLGPLKHAFIQSILNSYYIRKIRREIS